MLSAWGTHETSMGSVTVAMLPKILPPHLPLNEASIRPLTVGPSAKNPTATQALVMEGSSGCVVQEAPLKTLSTSRRAELAGLTAATGRCGTMLAPAGRPPTSVAMATTGMTRNPARIRMGGLLSPEQE